MSNLPFQSLPFIRKQRTQYKAHWWDTVPTIEVCWNAWCILDALKCQVFHIDLWFPRHLGWTRWNSERGQHQVMGEGGGHFVLTHWGRVARICVSNLTIIGSDYGLSPDRRQAIIWTNAGILLIGPMGTNFSEILIEIYTFPFTKMHLKMSSGKWPPFCLDLNVLALLFLDKVMAKVKQSKHNFVNENWLVSIIVSLQSVLGRWLMRSHHWFS